MADPYGPQMVLLTGPAPTPAPTYAVSGAVTPASLGNGATVTLSQKGTALAGTTVNSSGNYAFNGVAPGAYTVTPGKSGVTFSPASRSVTVASGNVTVPTFSASQGKR